MPQVHKNSDQSDCSLPDGKNKQNTRMVITILTANTDSATM